MPAKTHQFHAVPTDKGKRLDHFLAVQLPALSRSRIQHLIRQGHVTLLGHGVASKPGLRLHGDECIRVEEIAPPSRAAVPEPIPLTILYEDDDLVAIDKPAGMVVHVGAGVSRGTVVNALLYHFRQLSALAGPLRPGIVHRLDKNTSGVLLVAKNDETHRHLATQFRRREVEKHYLALVHGKLPRAHDQIRLRVARDLRRRQRMTTRRAVGREAVTDYHVLRELGSFTLVEATLRTGRTHQLRVHFSSIGHPVVGDTLYGAPRLLRLGKHALPTLDRNFLHAARVRFCHPRTGRLVEIVAPLPAGLETFLRQVEALTAG